MVRGACPSPSHPAVGPLLPRCRGIVPALLLTRGDHSRGPFASVSPSVLQPSARAVLSPYNPLTLFQPHTLSLGLSWGCCPRNWPGWVGGPPHSKEVGRSTCPPAAILAVPNTGPDVPPPPSSGGLPGGLVSARRAYPRGGGSPVSIYRATRDLPAQPPTTSRYESSLVGTLGCGAAG